MVRREKITSRPLEEVASYKALGHTQGEKIVPGYMRL
jgi:hypothetical protein